MNYRHAYHAGNFADVLKHVVLVRILVHLKLKAAPFRVIDTHAGAGLYDLAGAEAARTGEWRDGIGRVFDASWPDDAAQLLAPYLGAVRDVNPEGGLRHYPGSPILAASLLRPHDRLTACELEPVTAAVLAQHLRAVTEAKAVAIDGWTALKAYTPAKERRGVVIVDPAYEQPDDFGRLAAGVIGAWNRWPTGIYLGWYPIKSRDGPDALAEALRATAITKCLRVELTVGANDGDADNRLGACGVVVINPPWRLADEIKIIAPPLLENVGRAIGRDLRIDQPLTEGGRHSRKPL